MDFHNNAWFWVILGLTALVLVVVPAVPNVVRWVETKYLFQPIRHPLYRYYETWHPEWFTRFPPHIGGGVLHIPPSSRTHAGRPLVYLKGNAGSLDNVHSVLMSLHNLGYNVYAVEYPGYTPLEMGEPNIVPSGHSILACVRFAWEHIHKNMKEKNETIVMGMSLGGGVLGMVHHGLHPAPRQLVFVNTFYSLPQLVADFVNGCIPQSVLGSLQTQWETVAPPTALDNQLVVVAHARKDELIPFRHSEVLFDRFRHRNMNTRDMLDPNVEHVVMEEGGHNDAFDPVIQTDQWSRLLRHLLRPSL